jgi:hypothetical protein
VGSLFDDFDFWRHSLRASIIGASIARQAHDKMSEGRGAPGAEDMRRYMEEANALADLWDEAYGIAPAKLPDGR